MAQPAGRPPADPTTITAELSDLDDSAVVLVERWLRRAAARPTRGRASSRRLAAILADPQGLDFAVGFVERVIGTEDDRAAAAALSELGAHPPAALPAIDRIQLHLGAVAGRAVPGLVVPVARARMRATLAHLVVDARDRPFTRTMARLRREGCRLNINPLGEEVHGESEADRRLDQARSLLRRSDVDYVSVKVSAIASQLSMWAFDETVDYVVDRLAPLYAEAASAPPGSRFINLDMEEYRDLNLTVEVFIRLLTRPELLHYEGGIALQAYLPDALGAMGRLAAFSAERVARGGAGIKVRLVKGANLAMERVRAETAGWPLATWPSKLETDVNYKRVLWTTMRPDAMARSGLRLGVAGHNLFDIAFAHVLAHRRAVAEHVEFEMLRGMAPDQSAVVGADIGPLVQYVPTVAPREFDVAISYLVRRLEENAAAENFRSAAADLYPGGAAFTREANRFSTAVDGLARLLSVPGPMPGPNDRQDRAAEERRASPDRPWSPETPVPFRNEPDTNPALPGNRAWCRRVVARSAEPGWADTLRMPPIIDADDIDPVVAAARTAAVDWAARPADERAAILDRCAELLARRRGHLISVAAAEAGKTPAESDPEVSEAIDFARYYGHRARELDAVRGARFRPDRLIVVAPPWNFPIAIPAGGTLAALAAGAAVICKPAVSTPRCAMAVLETLWEAGVPTEVCLAMFPDEGPAGRLLISHPGVDRVLLTGATATAALFSTWRAGRAVNAETSGKNAIVITPAADRDPAVAALVHSAFGHAGQKCSAASLAILVGSVNDSARFRRQLVDAAASLVVDWPSNPRAVIGPLIEPPGGKLLRALTTLDPGEHWLLPPRRLDDSGRLWSPGIKEGVAAGSFFHRTECFGPVLGLMRARDLDEAIALQNATGFGLTAGLYSRDPTQVRTWLDRVAAGNLYVNRSITGAIVGRQPFGGWKGSSVGLGSKAGGPNYLMLLGRWSDCPHPAAARDAPDRAVAAFTDAAAPLLGTRHHAWLRRAAADDALAWRSEFGTARDAAGLRCEANLFRYRRADTCVRVGPDADPTALARVLAAARCAGSAPAVSMSPAAGPAVAEILALACVHLGTGTPTRDDDSALAARLPAVPVERIRLIGGTTDALRAAVAAHPGVVLLDDEVTGSGRVELRHWVAEQSVSITLHRFGNRDPDMCALADELTGARTAQT